MENNVARKRVTIAISTKRRKFTNKKCLRSQYTKTTIPFMIDDGVETSCTKCGMIAHVKCKSFLCCYNLCSFCKYSLMGCPICKKYEFTFIA
jgi:hypothetical protein